MSSLSYRDQAIISVILNQKGYVLEFSTPQFNKFTSISIGEPLCEKYNLSKGQSLEKYIAEADDEKVIKILTDLMEEFKRLYIDNITEVDLWLEDEETQKKYADDKRNYNKLIEIINRNKKENVLTSLSTELVEDFNSEYIRKQISIMNESISSNPTEAIGKAKELCESCCKTILKFYGVDIDKNWDVPRLTKETVKQLKITPDDIDDKQKASKAIKAILGNFSSITVGLAELRNPYGSGHGKDANYKGLSSRHAKLAVGSAITFTKFLWETFQEQEQEKNQKI